MSEVLIGAIIGAAAAIIGGIIGELIKYKLELKRERRKELKAIYEAIETDLHRLMSRATVVQNDELKLSTLIGKIVLHCRAEIVDSWEKLIGLALSRSGGREKDPDLLAQIKAQSKDLLILMRKDLGIPINDL